MAMSEAAKKAVPKSLRGVPGKSGTGSYPMATAKERGEAVALAAMHHGSNSAFTERIKAKAASIRKRAKKAAGIASLALLCLLVPRMADAKVQTIQVTIGASATQVSTVNLYCRWVVFQNNAAASMRLGDSTVSSTKGILLAGGSPGGSFTTPKKNDPEAVNLANWWVAGTQNQVLDVTCEQVAF